MGIQQLIRKLMKTISPQRAAERVWRLGGRNPWIENETLIVIH
jgi:hypothetical protein